MIIFELRMDLVELLDALEASKSWGYGRVLERWTNKQSWRTWAQIWASVGSYHERDLRKGLSVPLCHGSANGPTVAIKPSAAFCYSQLVKEYVNARGQLMKTMKHSMLLPHELVASFFQRADLWRMLVGGPGEAWHVVYLICNPSCNSPIFL